MTLKEKAELVVGGGWGSISAGSLTASDETLVSGAAGYPYKYMETDGGHIWRNWRIYLSEFVPLLFK